MYYGGGKACIVIPELEIPCDEGEAKSELGSHKKLGVAIPFQFEVDMTKLDEDKKKNASPSNSCLFASSNVIPLQPLFLNLKRLVAICCYMFAVFVEIFSHEDNVCVCARVRHCVCFQRTEPQLRL